MIRRFSRRHNTIVATDAGAIDMLMVHTHNRYPGWGIYEMAHLTSITCCNMRRCLAIGLDTVVATDTTADDLVMINVVHWNPAYAGMAVFTNICCINMQGAFTCCEKAIMAMDTGSLIQRMIHGDILYESNSGMTDVTTLKVDGGMTSNNLLMQLQADLTGIKVGKFITPTHEIQK